MQLDMFGQVDQNTKSPLNYTGGKFKLLPQIQPLLPEKIDTFVDLFCGGLDMSINVVAEKYIANDLITPIIDLYKYLQNHDKAQIIEEINAIIEEHGLTNTSLHGKIYDGCKKSGLAQLNKKAFKEFVQFYNVNPNPLMVLVLAWYSFNNFLNFNGTKCVHTGANNEDFHTIIKKKLFIFIDRIQKRRINFYSESYQNVEISNDAFVYIDPPYLITKAKYYKGWGEKEEHGLLAYVDKLNAKGIKFALSNVFENKGLVNNILIDWSGKYNVSYLDCTYANSSPVLRAKRDINATVEVLIRNYE